MAATPIARNTNRSYLPGGGGDESVNKASGYWDLKNAFLPLPGYYTLFVESSIDELAAEFEVQSTEASQVGNFSPGTDGGFDIIDIINNFDPGNPGL